jgi:hypothetical protein
VSRLSIWRWKLELHSLGTDADKNGQRAAAQPIRIGRFCEFSNRLKRKFVAVAD